MSKFAAILVTVAETAGGIGLLLGLLTPVAACAVVAAMIGAWAVTVSAVAFWSEPFNVPFVVALGATPALHRCRRFLGRREGLRPPALARLRHGRAVRGGYRGGRSHLDLAERDQPDSLQQPGKLKPTGR
jgi:hypothetical protein